MKVSCAVQTHIRLPREKVFSLVVPIDLTQIFRGFGPLPAVVGVKNQSGAWNQVGRTRQPILSDGSIATEELTIYESPQCFGYTIREFTGVLKWIVREARGEWVFESIAETSTQVCWKYQFIPRSAFTWPMVRVVAMLWKVYMKRVLQLATELVEASESA